jgi:pantoate kinase
MDRVAFCPGHITGFFEICRSDDILSAGSRGAGICLSLGATSRVTIRRASDQRIRALIAGSVARAEVTRDALKMLIGAEPLEIDVRTDLDLPMRQGFGMSAAGSLSATIAAADMLDIPRQKAFEAAHIAEVRCRCGLGDVSAIYGSGITIRKRAGLPPKGEVLRIEGTPELVLAVVGRGLHTKAVLDDHDKAAAINASGSRKVDQLVAEPSLEKLMHLSCQFASETGLASEEVQEAMRAASGAGAASMSMLGNSVFAVGDTVTLRRRLSRLGEVWTCGVDTSGPKVLESKS